MRSKQYKKCAMLLVVCTEYRITVILYFQSKTKCIKQHAFFPCDSEERLPPVTFISFKRKKTNKTIPPVMIHNNNLPNTLKTHC